MANKRLFITGGSGMVGSNLLCHGSAADWDIDAPTSSELDLLDQAAVHAYIEQKRPGVIIHAAGLVGGIQANISDPVGFMTKNMQMGLNLIGAAHDCGVQQLLNIGSSCMYPRNAANPLVEDDILTGELEPTNEGYALAKIAAMRLCQYIVRTNPALNYKTIIPCNLYGPFDKFHAESAHMIPDVIRKIDSAKQTSAKTVSIWSDGQARREFMYVGDLVDAVFKHLVSTDTPEVMNIGVGDDHTVTEYYEAIRETVGWDGQFVNDMSKPAGMNRKLVDISRQLQWGWQPKTSLHEGLHRTYEYYLSRKG